MPATLAQKTVAVNLLKQSQANVGAVNTALAGITALDPATSTSDDIQAQVDAYNAIRTNSRTLYGGVNVPALSADDAFAAVKTEADAA